MTYSHQILNYLVELREFRAGVGVFEIYDSNQLFRDENVG
jgi:hypothetical protein